MKYDIFISYRRVDSFGRIEGRDIARLLTKELKLYGYDVFFDYSEIKDNDFEEAILPAVRSCKVFILVLSPDALTRCSAPNDWVRREVMEAYRSGSKIITINPDYSFKSFPDNLPEEMLFLKTVQMSAIDMESNFEITVEKMVKERIQAVVPSEKIAAHASKDNSHSVVVEFGGHVFEMPDEFFNKHVYNALKRSYEP